MVIAKIEIQNQIIKAVEDVNRTNPMAGSITNSVTINFVANAQLAVGGVIGAAIGARMMKKIPAAQLKRMFGIMLILVGIRMVLP